MGGGQAMRIGLNHPELFASIGLFSPALRNLDVAKDYDGRLADAGAINKSLHLLWIGVGQNDSLHDPSKPRGTRSRPRVHHPARVDRIGWGPRMDRWRKYLVDFASRLLSTDMRRLLTVHLPRLYLQRFPLLLAGFLLLYVPFSLFVVPAMFRSTLVLSTAGLGFVTMFALLSASVVMTMRRAIVLCGPARFGIDWSRPDDKVSTRETVAHLLIGAPLVVVAAWLSATKDRLAAALLSVAGGISRPRPLCSWPHWRSMPGSSVRTSACRIWSCRARKPSSGSCISVRGRRAA